MAEGSGWYFWSADFWGKPRIRQLSTADKMRIIAVIDAANVLDSSEISDAVVNSAAVQLGEKPSQIREALQKLAGFFKTRDDGTPYLGKVAEKIRKRESKATNPRGGNVPQSVPQSGVNVGVKTYRKPEAVPSEIPNESSESARTVRAPLSEGTGIEGRGFLGVSVNEVQGDGSPAFLPGDSLPDSKSSKGPGGAALDRDTSRRNGNGSNGSDPIAKLVTRSRGLISAPEWTAALSGGPRDASDVLLEWDRLTATRAETVQWLLNDARRNGKPGVALVAHVLDAIANGLTRSEGTA